MDKEGEEREKVFFEDYHIGFYDENNKVHCRCGKIYDHEHLNDHVKKGEHYLALATQEIYYERDILQGCIMDE